MDVVQLVFMDKEGGPLVIPQGHGHHRCTFCHEFSLVGKDFLHLTLDRSALYGLPQQGADDFETMSGCPRVGCCCRLLFLAGSRLEYLPLFLCDIPLCQRHLIGRAGLVEFLCADDTLVGQFLIASVGF